jgi:hypothetical protein
MKMNKLGLKSQNTHLRNNLLSQYYEMVNNINSNTQDMFSVDISRNIPSKQLGNSTGF